MKTTNNGGSVPSIVSGNNDKPWRDSNGDVLCNTTLKEISRSWDQDTWDRFLKDTVEGCQQDLLVKDIEKVASKRAAKEAMDAFWVDSDAGTEYVKSKLEYRVEQLVWRLPPKEGEVVKHLFYENLSARQAARKNKGARFDRDQRESGGFA